MVVSFISQMASLTLQESLVKQFYDKVPKQQAVIAVQVYLELVEVKRYYSVEYHYNESLNKIIMTGKKRKDVPLCAFIPVYYTEHLDFNILQKFLTAHTYPSTFIVIVGPDTTSVYYELKDGLVEPEDNTAKHLKRDKQRQLDRDLEKHRDIIEEAALLSLKVVLPDQPSASNAPNTPIQVPENLELNTSSRLTNHEEMTN